MLGNRQLGDSSRHVGGLCTVSRWLFGLMNSKFRTRLSDFIVKKLLVVETRKDFRFTSYCNIGGRSVRRYSGWVSVLMVSFSVVVQSNVDAVRWTTLYLTYRASFNV